MHVRTFLPILALSVGMAVAAPSPVLAAPAAPSVDCQTTVNSAELLFCARIDLDAAEKSVAVLERKMMAVLRPNGRTVFTKVQAVWRDWRDAECAWNAYDIDSGASDALILATCRADMTMTRADELQSALEIVH